MRTIQRRKWRTLLSLLEAWSSAGERTPQLHRRLPRRPGPAHPAGHGDGFASPGDFAPRRPARPRRRRADRRTGAEPGRLAAVAADPAAVERAPGVRQGAADGRRA